MELADLVAYLSGVAILAAVYAVLALGLNVHWGATGILNIGIAGFYSLGAYTSALLTTAPPDPLQFEDFKFGGNLPELLGPLNLGLDLWFFVSILAAAALCGLVAIVIGFITLRLREDYLAITTLGIAEVIRLILLNAKRLSNGSRGLSSIPQFLGDRLPPQNYDLLYAGVCLLVVLFLFLALNRALTSPWGRVLRAIREDELTATASGKDVSRFKLQAFILGAAIMGVGGALHTHGVRFIGPDTFDPFLATFIVWAMLMVGGSGNNLGAILGAFLVWAWWSGTQTLPGFLAGPDLRYFLIGLLIIGVILFRPGGLLGETRWTARTAPPEPDDKAGKSDDG